jgi:putative membrane-bound dehydrogenase-like protein
MIVSTDRQSSYTSSARHSTTPDGFRMTVVLRWTLAAALYFTLIAAPAAPASQIQAPAEKDYASELPRFPIKSPAESLAAIVPWPGFRADLVAAEPLIRSPVAVEFDEDGRLFVAEYPEYNQYAGPNPGRAGKGSIRLLEDTRGNGIYDRGTLFAADIPMATALASWDGGLYVGSPPDLLYLKDTNGDGKADLRRVVLTGFGSDRAGEGLLNSIRWGLDNRFHMSTSLDGGTVRRSGAPDKASVDVRGTILLFDPRSETFELQGGAAQHGMTLDDWGRTYVCGNSDPFHLVMYDSRYLARNPYLRAVAPAINIAPAGKYTRLHRLSPVEPWRILRTRLRSQGIVPGSDEGGSPSGFFTGATGVTVYRGDAFPAEFHGNLFVGDVANNIIHRAIPEANGVRVTARSAEPRASREFLASRDCYFRPVQLANAPDGCLWVVDMCRELIEGAAFLPPQILKHMDVASGVDRGRIWRIAPEGYKPRVSRLSTATTAELVALLEHPGGWHRDTASRLLYQRQDRSAVGALRLLAKGSRLPIVRAHALSTLAGLGALEPDDILVALADPEARLRVLALRLAEPLCRDNSPVRDRMLEMAADPEASVRNQLAFSLGALPGGAPAGALAALAARDGADTWTRIGILSSVTSCTGVVFELLSRDASSRTSRAGAAVLMALGAQTGAAERPADLEVMFQALETRLSGKSDRVLARSLLVGLLSTDSKAVRTRLAGNSAAPVRAILDELLASCREMAVDEKLPWASRAGAIVTLRYAPLGDVETLLAGLLAPSQPQPVQVQAIETLARFDDARIPPILLRTWRDLSPKLRATAAEALFSRPAWVGAFLDAVENGTVSRADVEPARLELLKSYPDAAVRARAGRLFSAVPARRQDVVTAYQKALGLKGNAARGKEVFKSQCSTCHRLEGVGQQVGADLAAVRDRGMEAVLLNILDPNREVLPQFLSYVVVTKIGRVITGMIAVETATSLTIRQPDGREETVLRLHIDELRSTGLSYMPEGFEQQIDIPAMADLLAYLNSVR